MTSGRRVAPSTALLMVVEDGQTGIEDVTVVGVVVVAEVVVLTTRATTLSIASFTRVLITPVTLRAGWAAAAVLCMPATSTGAVVLTQAGTTVVVVGVVVVNEVVKLATKSTTLATASSTAATVVGEAVVLSASATSNMEDGTNPPFKISGSHLILIGAIIT